MDIAPQPGDMTLKRFILLLLTLFTLGKVLLSLTSSFAQPQIQARLELYQVNLSLYVAQWQPDDPEIDAAAIREGLVGDRPYEQALDKYQAARQQARETLAQLSSQLEQLQPQGLSSSIGGEPGSAQVPSGGEQQLREAIQALERFIAELNLKIGLLEAETGNFETAVETWEEVGDRPLEPDSQFVRAAEILSQLWSASPQTVAPEAESILVNALDGWFRDRSLLRLYRVRGNSDALSTLQTKQQDKAIEAIIKLAIVSAIPGLGGLFGLGLLIFLVGQRLFKGKDSLLATNNNIPWQTPWDWEVTWQVIIVGFFFVGQFVLPLLIGFSGINPSDWSIRAKAYYVLGSYFALAAGGLLVLYFSIRSYFPLPPDWFRLSGGKWLFWGIGGYLTAVPIVVIVSLVNQQIWQGQGGSNPLLFLAVQAQDWVALAVFFITASIAAPIFEETIFRGFLLPSLTRYVPVWAAIALSGLLFSIAHLSLAEVLPLFALGVVLGVVYTRSRSLLAPIVLHGLWNGGTLIGLFILGSGVD